MSSDEWYYAQNGQRVGPVSLAAIQSLLARGALSVEDFVWTDGLPNWSPAGTIPALSAATAVAPAATTTYAPPPPQYQQPYAQPQPAAYRYPTPYPPQGAGTVGYYTPPSMSGFPSALPYAGFWLRFVAFILDCLILWGIFACVAFFVGLLIAGFLASSRSGSGPVGPQVLLLPLLAELGLCVGAFLYFTLLESGQRQATWGKRALGLVVTNDEGGRITYGQAVGRFFGKWVSAMIMYIGFMMAGWTIRKQALHDLMAGTLVMRRA